VLGVRSSASDRLRCRVPGPGCQIAGTRYRVPSTWHLSSKNPPTGYASCILYPFTRSARLFLRQFGRTA